MLIFLFHLLLFMCTFYIFICCRINWIFSPGGFPTVSEFRVRCRLSAYPSIDISTHPSMYLDYLLVIFPSTYLSV